MSVSATGHPAAQVTADSIFKVKSTETTDIQQLHNQP